MMLTHPQNFRTVICSVLELLVVTHTSYAQVATFADDVAVSDLFQRLCASRAGAKQDMKRALACQYAKPRGPECSGSQTEPYTWLRIDGSDATILQLLNWCEGCEAELRSRSDHPLDDFDLTEVTLASMVRQRYTLHRNVQRVKRVRQLRYDMDHGNRFARDVISTDL